MNSIDPEMLWSEAISESDEIKSFVRGFILKSNPGKEEEIEKYLNMK